MNEDEIASIQQAIALLEAQRERLGDAVVEIALAPLRARLATLTGAAGLKQRQIAVLFVDVVGSTAMAQSLEAEDTLDLMNRTLRVLADHVTTRQGRVLRFTGDGLLAAFGMDQTREDDSERAVRAGLAMLQSGRESAEDALRHFGVSGFAVRVGVHTGNVALGAGVEADNTVMGATVNVAARMEQSAPPGALRISHDTFSLVRGLFDVEPQPPLLVKGVDAPMKTYLVRAALDRSVASVERGLLGVTTPLVGRDAELARLRDTVERARDTRQLQALTLVADAGIGKSRLLREFLAVTHGCRVLKVRSQPDGMLRPWGLLRSLLAGQFGVADTDTAEVARRKVLDGLAPWFEERGEFQARLVGHLSGLDFGDDLKGMDARGLRDQAFAAIRSYLQALAKREGAVPLLIVEDLHWADDSSLDLLEHLQVHADSLPVALVMTTRPALLTRRTGWSPADRVLSLDPLAGDHGIELARALLQRMQEVPDTLVRLLVGRAEGNPYYMEELVRRLVDDGVIATAGPHWTVNADRLEKLQLPGTLVGLLQARLDALPPDARAAARKASVIGHIFWDEALEALDDQAPRALPALQHSAFVRDHATSDFEGTAERQFDHHLLHQVTYDTLLKAERRLGHGAAARWLRERTQGRGAEFLAMTGEHADRAGETALAVDCFAQAGAEAAKRFANRQALDWLRRAVQLLGESDPARRFDLVAKLETVADTAGERAMQDAVHAEMQALLDRHPDEVRQARLWYSQGMLADRRGDRVTADRYNRQALEAAERCSATQTAALAHAMNVWLHIARHENEIAREAIEPGMRWAARIEDEEERASTVARLLTLSGMVLLRLSRYDEARKVLLDVVDVGETRGLPRLQLGALDSLAVVDGTVARWDDVHRWGQRMLDLAQATGNVPYVVMAQWRLAISAAQRGDTPAAIDWCKRNLPLARAIGERNMEAVVLRQLGVSQRKLGDVAAGRELNLQAFAAFMDVNNWLPARESAANAAECEIEMGLHEEARARVDEILAALNGELVNVAPRDTVPVRWRCQQILATLGDSRAAPLLEQLHADVQADLAAMAGDEERERVMANSMNYSGIVKAYGEMRRKAQ